MPQKDNTVLAILQQLNSPLDDQAADLGIVLAAGHGKRIRSETSKMLHPIWGKPTVLRVADAVEKGLNSPNQVIVVGIKGAEVADAVGKKPGRVFAYQENPVLGLPAGTGDAVKVGLDAFAQAPSERNIYIFLGDMGLLTEEVVGEFRRNFESQPSDMMVLTGGYSGAIEENYYGRIVRVPAADAQGAASGEDEGKVIEIKEHKDILGLDGQTPYQAVYNGRTYHFSRDDLLNIREINTGVFAFNEKHLRALIRQIKTDNVQGELMLTDLVHLFNREGLVVRAALAKSEEEILAFNNKSVWRKMEAIARRWAYERLMDIITIVDEEDFFIADPVIQQIIDLDKDMGPLDIVVGKGAHVGPQVRLNSKVHLGNHSHLEGNLVLGEGVVIDKGVQLSTYPDQTLLLEDGVEILSGNILKGNLHIGRNTRIESGVIMTGSDDFPMRIGRNATIKGTTYLFGCTVDDEVVIQHCVILCRHIRRVRRMDGTLQAVRFIQPRPEGTEGVTLLPDP